MTTRMLTLAAMTLAGSTMVLPQTAAAQNDTGVRPLISMRCAGLNAWLVDEKDAGLRTAATMLPDRARELLDRTHEVPDEARELLELALKVISRPMSFSVAYNDDDQFGGLFGYGIVVRFEADSEQDAREIHAALLGAAAEAGHELPGVASERFAGMMDVQLPVGLLSYGPGGQGDDWAYEIIVGSVTQPMAGLASLPKAPAGMQPVLTGSFDFSATTPGARLAQQMVGGAEIAKVFAGFEEAGLTGEHGARGTMVFGHTADEFKGLFRIDNAREHAQAWWLSTDTLTGEELSAIPGDAVIGAIGKFQPENWDKMAADFAEFGVPIDDILAQFEQQTGLSVQHDLYEPIGSTAAYYMSDTTGGGGLMSTVVLLSLDDPERFHNAISSLVGMANAAAGEIDIGPGSVRLHEWTVDGVTLTSLQFPGLPVPLEVSFSFTGPWMVAGLTPQAVVAASKAATGEHVRGIVAQPWFRGVLPRDRGITGVEFMNTPALVRDGYPLACLLGSALGNAVRSPSGGDDPGMVIPTYPALMRNAKPFVELAYWDGDALIVEDHADRSMLVNGCGTVGAVGKFLPLALAPAAIMGAKRAGMHIGMIDSTEQAAQMTIALIDRVIGGPVSSRRVLAVAAGFEDAWNPDAALHQLGSFVP